MTFDTHENLCPLSVFIKLLDEKNNLEKYNSDDLLGDILSTGNQTLKTFGPLLLKNYNALIRCQDQKEPCCNYLNYWLDKEKELYLRSISDSAKKNEKETIDKKKKRMDLMIYCTNRDYFKEMCNTSKRTNSPYCTVLNEYSDKHYIKFKECGCLNGKIHGKDYTSDISDRCTLYDASVTFPVYHIQEESVLEIPSSRESITQCEEASNQVHILQGTGEDLRILVEDSPLDYSTHWKSVLFFGLTFFGFSFVFLFLYKVEKTSFEKQGYSIIILIIIFSKNFILSINIFS
ncbi:PIR Superfamily Protein [Plasmodium ovale wallikeri]|uniref:PIR Superfamily Protein n=1 Tax=Plasmodium ovale wallikeri TaxID=864142 RepID=A0A1A9AIN5_PLAOA|nr:PIR Superfamily Protein [Plasmodium ovale wallikeri]SBT55955.1 PIR Superfamily Protein [Plasmodium ovale wallikeri]